MKDNGRCGEVLYRTVNSENGFYSVKVYKRLDGSFYVYRVHNLNVLTEEEFVGKCKSEQLLELLISTVIKKKIQ